MTVKGLNEVIRQMKVTQMLNLSRDFKGVVIINIVVLLDGIVKLGERIHRIDLRRIGFHLKYIN